MIVRDCPLSGNNNYNEGRAMVQLGIQPSVIEEAWDTASLKVTEHYRKVVLLMETEARPPSPAWTFES